MAVETGKTAADLPQPEQPRQAHPPRRARAFARLLSRAKRAAVPSLTTGRKAGSVLAAAGERWVDTEAYRLAASLSFYALGSVFPLMLLIVSLAGIVLGDDLTLRADLLNLIDVSGSPFIRESIDRALLEMEKTSGASTAGIVFGTLAGILSASGVFGELDTALNRIWGSEQPTTGVKAAVFRLVVDKVWSFLLVTLTGIAIVASLAGGAVLESIHGLFPGIAPPAALAALGPTLGLAAMSTLALTLWYRLIPDVHVAWRPALVGGAVAAVLLGIVRSGFGLLIAHLTNYAAYGFAGALLAMVMWIYVAALVALFGAAVAHAVSGAQPVRVTATHRDIDVARHRRLRPRGLAFAARQMQLLLGRRER